MAADPTMMSFHDVPNEKLEPGPAAAEIRMDFLWR